MQRSELPELPGLLSADQIDRTAACIVSMQEPDGALPWTIGQHTDAWNHVESAMALVTAGRYDAADAAYTWLLDRQRPDGSWPIRTTAGVVEDHGTDSNMTAYLAVGVWHHWLVRREEQFVEGAWPAVVRALDLVVGLQLPFGGIDWARDATGRSFGEALLTGSASIYHALRAGLALAELSASAQPEWELAAGRLGHALREHRDRFLDKSTFSMDWYYPVLGGAVRGDAGTRLLAARWDDFVVPGLGARCVSTNPWVTGAETCELALALDAIGDRDRACELLGDMQRLRTDDGGYWTGYVYADRAFWPQEQTTWTAGAVILAADALCGATGGAGIFRGDSMPGDFPPIGLECGCDDVASRVS